jgi:ABC-type bacteriocin/lantibiotic exporter with double-glycine peptidase domain
MTVTAACFGWCIFQLWNGQITYGSMTLFLQLASTLRGGFSALVSLAQQLISITTSAGRIMSVEELPVEHQTVPQGLAEEDSLEIQFTQTSFHYQNDECVLNPFDFTVHHGDTIAVIGPSGEGKTTLLRLLLGLVEPCTGRAELVGSSGKHYTISAGTRSVFAYVPQGNSVFAGTVAENLRLVKPNATDSELIQVLQTACAWDFVQKMPDTIYSNVGERGRGLSEGQAQRIAIARAVLRDAPILLLDEATSALDIITERKVLRKIMKKRPNKTCIVTTHRPSVLNMCQRVYRVMDTTITELDEQQAAEMAIDF